MIVPDKHHWALWTWMAAVLCVLPLYAAYAQDASMLLSVDRNKVAVGGRITVSFKIQGGNAAEFRAPTFKGFQILAGPNQSTEMSIVNGNVSQSLTLSYILQAQTEGTHTIGSASVKVNGKQIESNTATVTVVKGQANQEGNGTQQDELNLDDQVFLKVSVDKSAVYRGEHLFATYKLYTRADIVQYNVQKRPVFNGFWSQDIELGKQAGTLEVVNGLQYKVFTLKKIILFPQRSGTLELDPMEFECVLRVRVRSRRSRSLFDSFFDNYQNVKHVAVSKTRKITVKPLPDSAPDNFNGAVGSLNMEAWLDKPATELNEPITLKVKVSGNGNLELLDAPTTFFPPALEAYDPKVVDKITVSQSGVSGNRTFEYLLIPRTPGEYKIAPISFSYFDLDAKEYRTIRSDEFVVTVAKGDGTARSPVVSGVNKEDVQYLGKDILFIKSGNVEFRKEGGFFVASPLFYSLMAAPLFCFIGFVFYRRKQEKVNANTALLRNKKATRLARKRLALAKKALASNNREEYYEVLSKSLNGYLGDKLSISQANYAALAALEELRRRGVSEQTVERYRKTLETCEFARFAPSANEGAQEKLYEEALSLITSVEGELK